MEYVSNECIFVRFGGIVYFIIFRKRLVVFNCSMVLNDIFSNIKFSIIFFKIKLVKVI